MTEATRRMSAYTTITLTSPAPLAGHDLAI